MKLSKVFYADEDENEIISTLFYIHKDLDACLIRTAADISQIIGQVPCMNEVCSKQFIAKMDFLSKIWYVILRVITKMTVFWYRNDRCTAKMTVGLPKWPWVITKMIVIWNSTQNDRYLMCQKIIGHFGWKQYQNDRYLKNYQNDRYSSDQYYWSFW